jgi:hypothetical protein
MKRHRRAALLALLILAAGAQQATASDVVLSLDVTGVGASVAAVPTGVLQGCDDDVTCRYRYPAGTRVTLTAMPTSAGSRLARWLGACSGTQSTCSVRLSHDASVAARFSPVQLYTGDFTPGGEVAVDPPGDACGLGCWSFPYGTPLLVEAEPAEGSAFSRWYGLCSAELTSACSFTIVRNVETSAVFCTGTTCSGLNPLTQTVTVTANVVGSGSITLNGHACAGRCSFRLSRGQPVAVRARYNAKGAAFRGWSGACLGSAGSCQFAAIKDAASNPPVITARFG